MVLLAIVQVDYAQTHRDVLRPSTFFAHRRQARLLDAALLLGGGLLLPRCRPRLWQRHDWINDQ